MTTTINLMEWKTGIYSATGLLSGYSGSRIPEYDFLEVFSDPDDASGVVHVAGTIDVSQISTGQVMAPFSFIYPTSGTSGGNANMRIETGSTLGAGSTFTILKPEGVFSGNSVREVKVWPEYGRWEFNPSAISNLSITNVTVSGNVDGSIIPARLIAELVQQARTNAGAVSGGSDGDVTYEGTAGENLVEGVVYSSGGTIYQFDNARDVSQAGVGWIETSYSTGATVTVVLRKKVSKPSAITGDLPTYLPLYASPGGVVTWRNDTEDPLSVGDYQHFIGRSYDGASIWVDCVANVGTMR